MYEENAVPPNKENDICSQPTNKIMSAHGVVKEQNIPHHPHPNPDVYAVFVVQNDAHVCGYINYQDNVQMSLVYQKRRPGLGH